MSTLNATATTAHTPQPRRTARQVLLSYFYWTYSRGSFHYDVMVTLILAFIFVTPWLWNYAESLQEPGDSSTQSRLCRTAAMD